MPTLQGVGKKSGAKVLGGGKEAKRNILSLSTLATNQVSFALDELDSVIFFQIHAQSDFYWIHV